MKNRIGILIASHGNLCSEILVSAEMILGKQEDVYTESLFEDGISDFKERLFRRLDQMAACYEEIIFLADIKNATPYNTGLMYMAENIERKVYIVSGYNLAMIVELLVSKGYMENTETVLTELLQAGKDSMDYMDIKLWERSN